MYFITLKGLVAFSNEIIPQEHQATTGVNYTQPFHTGQQFQALPIETLIGEIQESEKREHSTTQPQNQHLQYFSNSLVSARVKKRGPTYTVKIIAAEEEMFLGGWKAHELPASTIGKADQHTDGSIKACLYYDDNTKTFYDFQRQKDDFQRQIQSDQQEQSAGNKRKSLLPEENNSAEYLGNLLGSPANLAHGSSWGTSKKQRLGNEINPTLDPRLAIHQQATPAARTAPFKVNTPAQERQPPTSTTHNQLKPGETLRNLEEPQSFAWSLPQANFPANFQAFPIAPLFSSYDISPRDRMLKANPQDKRLHNRFSQSQNLDFIETFFSKSPTPASITKNTLGYTIAMDKNGKKFTISLSEDDLPASTTSRCDQAHVNDEASQAMLYFHSATLYDFQSQLPQQEAARESEHFNREKSASSPDKEARSGNYGQRR